MNSVRARAAFFSTVTLGITSMISQIIVLRELLIAFSGNELSVGLMLASWLILVGAGSSIAGRITQRLLEKAHSMVLLQVALSLVIPATVFVASCAGKLLTLSPGEIVAPLPMVLLSASLLSPLCLLLGFAFTLLCASWSVHKKGSARIGTVYALEAAGSSAGGLVFGLVLIRILSPVEAGFILSGLNLIAASCGATSLRTRLVPASLLVAYIIAAASGATAKLERTALRARWSPFELESDGNSVYGNVAVVSLRGEKAFYENGLFSFSTGDDRSAEETAHIPLLSHPDPRRVLLIGGGVSGTLREILKHPVEDVTYVELDPLIVSTAEGLGLPEIENSLHDPRVRIVCDDGRRYVKSSRDAYDVIICDLPDPLTALVNRFYSVEYYREAERMLLPDGILSLGLTSAENYLNTEQQRFAASVHASVRSCFGHVLLVPGDPAYILASNDASLDSVTPALLLERRALRGIEASFITEGYLPQRMDPARTAFFASALAEAKRASRNSDLRPAGYFYATVAWLTRLNSRDAYFMNRISLIKPAWYILPFGILFAGLLYPALFKRDSGAPVAAAILTTGYSEMVFQVVVIYTFQVLFGYLYYRLGVILASFMLGLSAGGLVMTLGLPFVRSPRRLFLGLQGAMCAYPVFLAVLALWFSAAAEVRPLSYAAQTAFAFLPVTAGFLGGIQFPLASHIILEGRGSLARTAGYLYGIDLLGSCLGALTAAAVMIPLLGVTGTCLVAFSGNAASFLLIALALARRRLWP